MEIEREKLLDGLELRLTGRLDAQQAAALEADIEDAIHGGDHRLRLNMAGIDFISSAGIRCLVKYYKTIRKLGGMFAVVEPSAVVKNAIRLTGLGDLLAASEERGEPPTVLQAQPERQFGPARCIVLSLDLNASFTCECAGDPAKLEHGGYAASDMVRLTLPRGAFGLGLGAFGATFEDCRPRFGEFLAAGGLTAYLPADGSKTPDYLVAKGALIPEIHTLYAMAGHGAFSHCIRFDTHAEDGPAPWSLLASAALDVANAPAVVVVALAETMGLIGAALRKSPVHESNQGVLFDHPEVRQRLMFTTERAFDRSLVLVAGVAASEDRPELGPLMRRLGNDPWPTGHFHALAFNYRALPKGLISLENTLADILEDQSPLGLLHLLNDTRPIAGAGESLFVRGAIWAGPIAS